MPTFLFVFAHVHLDFRLAELEAVSSYFGIPVAFDKALSARLRSPFVFVEVGSEADAKTLASRMVLLRYVVDVWGHADTAEDCYKSVQACPQEKVLPYCGKGSSFKFKVEAFGRHFSFKEKVEWMERFHGLTVPERCEMDKPDIVVWIVVDIGVAPEHNESDPPSHVYFGRQVTEGRREWESRITLKKRTYLGTTSTDAQLTLLYANQAHAGPGKLVWDPCCGTASILVGCAFMGATCMGSDLDFKVIHGKDGGNNIAANFRQYSLSSRLLDCFLMDLHFTALRPTLRFDAIVTDPPYGMREGTRKVHANEESEMSVRFRDAGRHATQLEKLSVGSVLLRLLDLAAERLVVGGRLVFLFPSLSAQYDDSQLPSHPCLRLLANSEQPLTLRWSRRLITMEKTHEPQDGHVARADSGYDVRKGVHRAQE